MKVCMVKPAMAAFDSYAPGGSHERFGSRQSLRGQLPFCSSQIKYELGFGINW